MTVVCLIQVHFTVQSTLVISKSKGPSETFPDDPYIDISDLHNGGKYKSNNQISQIICNLTS